MKEYLLDTDILIDFFKNQPHAQKLISQAFSKSVLYISVISVAEIISGWSVKERENLLPALYGLGIVVGVTQPIAEKAGILRAKYLQSGRILSISDTLIAATAMETEYIVTTRNKKDFHLPEIKTFFPY